MSTARDNIQGRMWRTYEPLYNYQTQQEDAVYDAKLMDAETAVAYIPNTPRAQRLYLACRQNIKQTPYESMKMVVDIIMNGQNKRGKTSHYSRNEYPDRA